MRHTLGAGVSVSVCVYVRERASERERERERKRERILLSHWQRVIVMPRRLYEENLFLFSEVSKGLQIYQNRFTYQSFFSIRENKSYRSGFQSRSSRDREKSDFSLLVDFFVLSKKSCLLFRTRFNRSVVICFCCSESFD